MKTWIIEKDVFKDEEGWLINSLDHLNISHQWYNKKRKYNPEEHILRCSTQTLKTTPEFISLFNYHLPSCLIFEKNMLNFNCVQYTFENLLINQHNIFQMLGIDNKIWVKPDSPFKPFEASLINKKWLSKTLEIIRKDSGELNPSCIISSPKDICEEYRFFVNKTRILSGSSYKNRGDIELYLPIAEDIFNFAESMAELYYEKINFSYNYIMSKADHLWVLDVCRTKSGDMKIVELNSFYSAGFYSANIKEIIKGAE